MKIMDKTRRGSFGGLLYREFYLVRKNLITYVISFAAIAFVCWLTVLSFYYGNLGKLITSVLADGNGGLSPEAGETFENMRRSLFFSIKLYPAAMTGAFAIIGPDIAAKDTRTIWQRFERCTPVTPLRFAAVKTSVNALGAGFTLAFGTGYMFLIGLVSDEYLTCAEMSLYMLFVTLFVMFGIISQIFILLIGDRDKGMLASMGVIMVSVWIFSNYARELGDSGADGLASLSEASQMLMPFMPLIYIGAFGVLFAAMYLIYKRREK